MSRPPLALRAVAGLLAVAALLFNGLLMLSDRAPGLMRRIGGTAVRRLFERIDAGGRGADILTDPRLPESDTLVHVAVWAIAVVLVGWAVWSWYGLLLVAIAMAGCSLAVEALQERLSTSRTVELSDVRGNLAGVALGTATVAACYLLYSAASAVVRGALRRPAH